MGPDAKIRPLPPLTSLRFFAAASIVIMHSAGKWGMPPLSSIHFAVGVDLFFILSGFILAIIIARCQHGGPPSVLSATASPASGRCIL
jgi:peptidoglycan/LPS O-acetylase OafA/YrhL